MAQVHADILTAAGYPRQAAVVVPAPVPVPPVVVPGRAPSIPVPPDPVGAAIAGAVNAGTGAIAGVGSGVLGAVDSLGSIAVGWVKAANWVSNRRNWVRVAYVAGGVTLVLGALLMVVTQRSESRASAILGVGTKIFAATKGKGATA